MRPRKKILAFAPQELGTGVLVFAIDNTGRYRTRAVHDSADFIAQLSEWDPDVALVFLDRLQDAAAVRACQSAAHAHDVPMLLVKRAKGEFESACATMTLLPGQVAMVDILHALRIVFARKRGPKKADSTHQQYIRDVGQHVAEANGRLYA